MDSPVQDRYYRCYFISNDHIFGYKNVFSNEDVSAIEKLGEILAATKCLSVELWRGEECVAKLDKILPTLEQTSAS
jgi:hypothetical protein